MSRRSARAAPAPNRAPVRAPDATDRLFDRYSAHLAGPSGWNADRSVARSNVRTVMRRAHGWHDRTRAAWDAFGATPLERIWVWSDLHIGHANIIKYAGRAVPDVEAMNALMLERAAVVPTDDWLLFGGDVAMKMRDDTALVQWLRQCPGRKALILGNHDIDRIDRWAGLGFEAIAAVRAHPLPAPLTLGSDRRRVDTLWWTHYPMSSEVDPAHTDAAGASGAALPPGVLNVHGHIHDKRLAGPYVNMCVEHQGLGPERLSERLARWSSEADAPFPQLI